MVGKISELETALERVGAGPLAALYISMIDSQAERADIEDYGPRSEIDLYGPILAALLRQELGALGEVREALHELRRAGKPSAR